MGMALAMLGSVHERQGEYGAALEKYRQALGIFQGVGMAYAIEAAQQDIARVLGRLGGEG
jgi:hypothetical protein